MLKIVIVGIIVILVLAAVAYYLSAHGVLAALGKTTIPVGYNVSGYNATGYNATGYNAMGYNSSVPRIKPT